MALSFSSNTIKQGAKFGLVYACLLGLAMSFVIFVGSIMGDCDPGPGCHDNDAAVIGRGILSALPIIIFASTAVCAGAGVARDYLAGRIGAKSTDWLLAGVTVGAAWGSFDLAMRLFMWVTA